MFGRQAAPLWTMFYPAEPGGTFPEDVPWKNTMDYLDSTVT